MMQIDLTAHDLNKIRLMVGTPMYGGMAHGLFVRSMCDLTLLCERHGISLDTCFVLNESLVPRARVEIAARFLRSDCTHLMFIDADIGFVAQDVLALLALSGGETIDVIAGAYPHKHIAWDQLTRAVAAGITDPSALAGLTSPLVFNPLDTANGKVPLGEPLEVSEAATGFMLIRRATFELFDRHYPELRFRSDDPLVPLGQRDRALYFEVGIDPQTLRYLSEDYAFCRRIRAAGGHVWLCPWMNLAHVGGHTYRADPAALARIGVPLAGSR
jgi:hypothetical protein